MLTPLGLRLARHAAAVRAAVSRVFRRFRTVGVEHRRCPSCLSSITPLRAATFAVAMSDDGDLTRSPLTAPRDATPPPSAPRWLPSEVPHTEGSRLSVNGTEYVYTTGEDGIGAFRAEG